jgi:small-conductance mechanosensitive channel
LDGYRGGGGIVKIRRLAGLALVLAALLSPVPSPAQDGKGPAAGGEGARVAETEAADVREPVTLDGETLFRVRGVSAYPAGRRARDIGERIEAVARNRTIATEALRVVEAEGRSILMAADRPLVTVFDGDAHLEDIDRKLLAEIYKARIAVAIKAYRGEREPRVLLIRTLYALGATVLFLAVLWGIRWGHRRIFAGIERRYRARIERFQAETLRVIRSETTWRFLGRMLRVLRAMIMLLVAGVYLYTVFALYPWTRPLSSRLFDLLLEPLATLGRGLLASAPDLLFLAVLAVVVRFLLQIGRLFAGAVAEGSVTMEGFDREWAIPTFRIVRVLIVAFALVVAYPYIPGSGSEAFKGVSIFLGVIFSIGSSSLISNVIAGYSMTYRRAFHIGDRIQVGDFIGDVIEIRNQVTHLRTPKNEEIVVPNSVILNTHVVNYSSLARQRGLILHTRVGIGYEVPWRQVEAMLLLAAERSPGLLREPPPFVLQKSLGDFAITYELNVHCDNPSEMGRLYTVLHRSILDVFNEYGVQIMTPAYEGDPEQPKVVPPEQWHARPAPPPDAGG